MTRSRQLVLLLAAFATVAFAAAVGDGAATPAIRASFINAWNRGVFSLYVTDPTAIRALGTPGLVQEFPSKANSSLRYALIKPDPNAPLAQFDTLQVYSDIYTYFTSLGVATVGYPTMDTTACPANDYGVCNYQLFTKNYALFSYAAPLTSNYAIRDPFYTVWNTTGGISGPLGVATGAETSLTSVSKVVGTQQTCNSGSIFSYPTGSATPSTYSVSGDFYSAWATNGGYTSLGFPTSEAILLSTDGPTRQTFENGRIERAPGGTPVVLYPVSLVGITFASSGLSLAPGESATISATTLDVYGRIVTGRTMTWSSTNGAVARVTGNGYSATVQAIAAGTANIFVTTEGKTSPPISVRVGGACCLVGEGAPTQTMSQAFQSALDRNQLTATLPVAAPVSRVGAGYIQTVNAGGTTYVVSLADTSGTAYVSGGSLYAAYVANGGFAGPLGYPASDPAGGVQRYAGGAVLAGLPVRLLSSAVAAKWFALGGPAGSLGLPTADATAFQSLTGTSGFSQFFAGGALFATGQTYVSSGPILDRYLALGGPTGALGAPTGDLANNRQNFEIGYIDLQPGAAAAVEHFNARKPAVSVTPATVVPGARVHVSTTGFAPGANLKFVVTGQPNFSVRAAAGIFEWDILVPAVAKSGVVTIQVAAPGSADTASGSYTISSAAALLPRLALVSGDQQTGAPGSTLAAPLVLSLVDSSGAPIAGVPVGWSLSPGASVTGSAVTDAAGRAVGLVRLPPASGVVVGSASAAGQVVSFSALGAARTIGGFPSFSQTGPNGGPVAAIAALIRHQQNQGTLGAPRGLATVAGVEQYLQANKGYAASESSAQIANPWVAAGFAAAGLNPEAATLNTIRDAVAAGTPLAVVLALKAGGTAVVDAIGVNADGTVVISDPNPAFARTSLQDYLANGAATLAAVLRVTGTAAPVNSFTIATPFAAQATAGSINGACAALDLAEATGSGGVRFHYCEKQGTYELDVVPGKGGSVLDLTTGTRIDVPSDANSAFRIAIASPDLTLSPQIISIAAVTDAAGFGNTLAPGSIISIFGTGLNAGGKNPTVTLAGRALQVLFATPFQVNAVIPGDLAVGSPSLQVTSPLGVASQAVAVTPTGPGIFVIGRNSGNPQGAVVNQDGSINGPTNPATRGSFISIYGTGMGATVLRNGLQATATPVTASINGGAPVPVSFSGAVAGFVGLYQVNLQIPAATPPGLATPITLLQGGKTSNSVVVALQ